MKKILLLTLFSIFVLSSGVYAVEETEEMVCKKACGESLKKCNKKAKRNRAKRFACKQARATCEKKCEKEAE